WVLNHEIIPLGLQEHLSTAMAHYTLIYGNLCREMVEQPNAMCDGVLLSDLDQFKKQFYTAHARKIGCSYGAIALQLAPSQVNELAMDMWIKGAIANYLEVPENQARFASRIRQETHKSIKNLIVEFRNTPGAVPTYGDLSFELM